MKHWLMKSEPSAFSFDDLVRQKRTHWDGVRNYQARNFMRDEMKKGDLVLFYHSNAEPSAAAGIAEVVREAYPEEEDPRWLQVDLAPVRKLENPVSLERMKATPALASMDLLRRGNRLSLQKVTKAEFDTVLKLAKKPE
jgi:predicted RNA-binding protein with PUA-like domain